MVTTITKPASKTAGTGSRLPEKAPRPDEIKRSVDPLHFYQAEIVGIPPLKAGSDGWTQNVRCPFHEDSTSSFGVNLKTGGYRCFGCESHGGSVIDFLMERDGLDLNGARAEFGRRYDVRPTLRLQAVKTPPAQAPTKPVPIPTQAMENRPQKHEKCGTPSQTWTYLSEEGEPVMFVFRFDPPAGRKFFIPQTWSQKKGWVWEAPPEPRVLYNLPRLLANPGAQVVVCEGEKAADSAARLLPEAVAVTSMNGAQSAGKTDFSPLAGRRVAVWPDYDESGASFAAKVVDLARSAGAAKVGVLDLKALAVDPQTGVVRELPEGWDAADAEAEGWSPEAATKAFLAGIRWNSEAKQEEPGPLATVNAHLDPHAIEEERNKLLDDFSNSHALVMVHGRACMVYREVDEDSGRHVTRFSTPRDIELKVKPLRVPILKQRGSTSVKEWIPLFPMWLDYKYRRAYQQLVFKPVAGLVASTVALPQTSSLNLFQGLAFQPSPGCCDLIVGHIRDIWCSGSPVAFSYVMNWLARLFQKPEERGHTVLILKSGEGTGKNIIVDVLVEALSPHAKVAVKSEDLTGRFNDDLATSVLVFANEAVWGGRKELEGALKSLITDQDLPVERKYIPRFTVKNCCHLIMASNNDWVAPIGLDDRRFVVLDVCEARKGDFAYFEALQAEIGNGGKEAFIFHLLNMDISGFNPRVLPELGRQSTKFDAKVRGADSVTQWWLDCLTREQVIGTVEREVGSGFSASFPRHQEDLAPGWCDGESIVDRGAIYDAYVDWCRKINRHIEANSIFGKKFFALSGARSKQHRSSEGNRTRVYVVPPLSECRCLMESHMHQPGPWSFVDADGGAF